MRQSDFTAVEAANDNRTEEELADLFPEHPASAGRLLRDDSGGHAYRESHRQQWRPEHLVEHGLDFDGVA